MSPLKLYLVTLTHSDGRQEVLKIRASTADLAYWASPASFIVEGSILVVEEVQS